MGHFSAGGGGGGGGGGGAGRPVSSDAETTLPLGPC